MPVGKVRVIMPLAATIPERRDQQNNRARRSSHGGRPPGFDSTAYTRRNVVERCSNRFKQFQSRDRPGHPTNH
ncbi:hypothetical protein GCM10022222_86560 [Amycolatopsis ultiminotia]|uniref:Transposase n=1 Tax=Amycolatopsis ultiminotia TaxID=543629 RepID=A0ABP6YRK8_9PSEU